MDEWSTARITDYCGKMLDGSSSQASGSCEKNLDVFGTGTHVDAMIASIKVLSLNEHFEQRDLCDAEAKLVYSV
jgi:hypothetical protein